VPLKIHAAARVEADALALETQALRNRRRGIEPRQAQPAVRRDNPVPRQRGTVGQRMQRVASDPRRVRQAGLGSHLAVGHHPAARNARHDRVDA
jgi:predicted metal-dependent TIM-barrel fold hydrolase